MPLTLLKNLGRYLATLVVASVLVFLALRVVPGNPAEIALGITATPEAVAQLEKQMGLDRPLLAQYFSWVGGMLQGDFGTSLTSGTDISPMVVDRLQVSLILILSSMALAMLLAIPFGLWAARRAHHADGIFVTALSQVGIAVPSFLAGILMVALFSIQLGWLPPNGWAVPGEDFGGFLRRIVLPVVALGLVQAAIMTRYVRSAVLEVMNQDFMRTARAKGLSPRQALRAHGLRNAALPVLTVTGLQMTSLLVGAVVIEKVFVIPGLGSMLLTAVTSRDLATVQTIVMVLVVFAIVVNAAVDVIYTLVDPRTRRNNR